MNEPQWERGREWLETVLALMEMQTSVKHLATEVDVEPEISYWLEIDSTQLNIDQKRALMGVKGEPLDALQYLANTLLNIGLEPEAQHAYTLELDGYRQHRQSELRQLADDVVQQVRSGSREVEIPELSAAERRQVHTFLSAYDDVTTYSRGQDPDRRLVCVARQP